MSRSFGNWTHSGPTEMPIERLTDARLRGLTYEDGELIDAKSALMARADKTGTVTFTTRYRFGNKRPRIFLGTYPLMPLDKSASSLKVSCGSRALGLPLSLRVGAGANQLLDATSRDTP
jgi:hypothetical protein